MNLEISEAELNAIEGIIRAHLEKVRLVDEVVTACRFDGDLRSTTSSSERSSNEGDSQNPPLSR